MFMNFIHNITIYLLDHDIQTMFELEMEIILHVEAYQYRIKRYHLPFSTNNLAWVYKSV